MENASKALIIAGSVLIAILLIALGIKYIKPGEQAITSSEDALNTTTVANFNSRFTQYVGSKNKAQLISLLNLVISNNANNSSHKVKINNSEDIKGKINAVPASINTYKINLRRH